MKQGRPRAGKAGKGAISAGSGTAPRRTSRTLAQFDTHVAVLQAAETLQRGFTELLKKVDLSGPQYNVLRVLRGAGSTGMACGEVGGRLIRHDPDVTRLMDRLVGRGLVERVRDARDRRVVRTRITPKGLDVLGNLDEPVDALHERQLGHMSAQALGDLARLLREAGGAEE